MKVIQRHEVHGSHLLGLIVFLLGRRLLQPYSQCFSFEYCSVDSFLAFVSSSQSLAMQQMMNRQNHSVGSPSANTGGKLTCQATILPTTLCYQFIGHGNCLSSTTILIQSLSSSRIIQQRNLTDQHRTSYYIYAHIQLSTESSRSR